MKKILQKLVYADGRVVENVVKDCPLKVCGFLDEKKCPFADSICAYGQLGANLLESCPIRLGVQINLTVVSE